ncbi:MAG: hypothetical protein F6J90_25815 [Moorea sp. SIOASIH]|nr:hypothetical protein [Moorena sp. SIOASIH]
MGRVCVRNLRPHRCLPRGTAVAHGEGLCAEPASAPLFAPWKPRQSLMGETPKTALPPQDRAASPRPHCLPCSEAASLFVSTWLDFVLDWPLGHATGSESN